MPAPTVIEKPKQPVMTTGTIDTTPEGLDVEQIPAPIRYEPRYINGVEDLAPDEVMILGTGGVKLAVKKAPPGFNPIVRQMILGKIDERYAKLAPSRQNPMRHPLKVLWVNEVLRSLIPNTDRWGEGVDAVAQVRVRDSWPSDKGPMFAFEVDKTRYANIQVAS